MLLGSTADALITTTRPQAAIPKPIYETALGTATVRTVTISNVAPTNILISPNFSAEGATVTARGFTEVIIQNQDATANLYCGFDASVLVGVNSFIIYATATTRFGVPAQDSRLGTYYELWCMNDGAGTTTAGVLPMGAVQ